MLRFRHIDLVILSHPDLDHVSGLVEMAKDEDVEIRHILMHRPWEELSPLWFKDGRITKNSLKERLGEAFEKAKEFDVLTKNITKSDPEVGSYFFNDASITILGPTPDFYKICIANCEKTPQQRDNVVSQPHVQGGKGLYGCEPYIKGRIRWYNDENTSPINE